MCDTCQMFFGVVFLNIEEYMIGFLINVTVTCGKKNSRLGLIWRMGTYGERAMWLLPQLKWNFLVSLLGTNGVAMWSWVQASLNPFSGTYMKSNIPLLLA